jgi:myo-inositol 2-dehydrogenase / D-chiro-inositol 1-dehydrogenase
VSGGIFRDCGVHDFDAIGELCDVDTAAAVLRLDDETLALVSNSRYNAHGYDARLELHGSLDSIAAGLDDRLPLRSAEPAAIFPASSPHRCFADRFAAAYRAELIAFTELVAGERPSPCTMVDAVESSWVAEAATASLQQERPVSISEVRE